MAEISSPGKNLVMNSKLQKTAEKVVQATDKDMFCFTFKVHLRPEIGIGMSITWNTFACWSTRPIHSHDR